MQDDLDRRIRELLESVGDGPDAPTAEELLPLVYDQLRRLARGYLRRERAGHTLDATGLVHEAYERLVDQSRVRWQGRSHFFAVGAQAMRRVLVDHARSRGRQKRGGDWQRVTFTEAGDRAIGGELDFEQLLSLDAALERLARLDPRQVRVVELRWFAGMTTAEVAELLGVSNRTVEGDWAHARSWLRRELEESRAR